MGIVALILMLACVNLSRHAARAGGGPTARDFDPPRHRRRPRPCRAAVDHREPRARRPLAVRSGLALAGWLQRPALRPCSSTARDVVLSLAPDWRVLALHCARLMRRLPRLRAWRRRCRRSASTLNPTLKEVQAHGLGRLGAALVVAQLTLSMILIVGATLFVGTFVRLSTVDRGFEQPRHSGHERPAHPAVFRRSRRHRAIGAAGSPPRAARRPIRRARRCSCRAGGVLVDVSVHVDGYAFRDDESDKVGFNGRAGILSRRSARRSPPAASSARRTPRPRPRSPSSARPLRVPSFTMTRRSAVV